jgi:hypothetical protein
VHTAWRILVTLALVTLAVGTLPLRDEPQSSSLPSVYASIGLDGGGRVNQGDNDNDDNDNGDDGDNGAADNEDDDNDDGDNDEDNNDNDNDEDEGDDNDNGDDSDICAIYDQLGIAPPPSLDCGRSVGAPSRTPEPSCSTPGKDAAFTSYDGKVTLRVFASSPLSVRVVIYQVVNAETAPSPPGTYVRPLVYEIWASHCDSIPVSEFPAEVNLGIRYSDLEATGLDETRFVIGRLDVNTAAWVAVEKGANDPPANYVSATITRTGYYMVWEAR